MWNIVFNVCIVLVAFVAMEGVAWLSHKYIMHGFMWKIHKDHHRKEEETFIEHNDSFFIIFATPGILLLWFGMQNNFNFLFWIGVGITIYGFTYFVVHDIFIHQRFKFLRRTDSSYFRAIRKAHKVHHKHLNKDHGECFGMLWVPLKYFKETSKGD